MKISLCGSVIRLDGALHVAMLEVTRESDGAVIKVVHETGRESEEDFTLTNRSRVEGAPLSSGRGFELPGVPEKYLEIFPLLREIDVRNPPLGYWSSSTAPGGLFSFESGQRYGVFILSETLSEMTVVAD